MKGIKAFFRQNLGILVALVALCVLLAILPITRSSFVNSHNIFNVLRQVSTNMFIACGMTMVIILGGIVHLNMPLPIAVIIGIGIGALVGAFNGLVISRTTIPAFIVTLATMNIARGAAYVYTGGSPVRVMTDAWKFIGAGRIGPIPTPVIIMIIVLCITGLIMNRTRLGRHIYAVGGNPQAAEFSGINVRRVKFLIHLYSGIMAGLAGIVLASRMYSGQPTAGDGAEMDAIAAVVVGGTSMSGGSGKIGGTIIGALIIGVLNNGLNLMNVNSFWQYIVKGCVILGAVFVDFLRNRNKKS